MSGLWAFQRHGLLDEVGGAAWRGCDMKLGVIGAGFIGRAIATLAVRSGHEVMISNSRGPRTLGSTTVAIGCKAGTAQQAAEFGDAVLLAIPFGAYRELDAEPLAGKLVMDAGNYYPERDGQIAELDQDETTTSELLAIRLVGARVVKAFNAILQQDLVDGTKPPPSQGRRALPVAGDDASAKQVVTGLHDQFGYDVVDAGPLSEGWRFQRAMPAYCIPLDATTLAQALAAAKRGEERPHGSWRR
jgi:predicted dinucleotide-binding enzyme